MFGKFEIPQGTQSDNSVGFTSILNKQLQSNFIWTMIGQKSVSRVCIFI